MKIKELLEIDREKALEVVEKNRDFYMEYNWFESIFEEFSENVKKLGFDVITDDIQFSGFWCQGDGASFTGTINLLDFLRSRKKLTKFKNLVRCVRNNTVENIVSIERTSTFYSHENTCTVCEIEVYDDIGIISQQELEELQELVEEARLDLCKNLYEKLEDECAELSSDEAIIKSLEIDEIEIEI
jgi:hypothetical protein